MGGPTAVGLAMAQVSVAAQQAAPLPAGGSTPLQVSGAVNVNTKGISLVPALTLGKPSTIFDLVVRRSRVSFEPQFRFATDGTPWSFLLWGRFRAVQGEKFRLTLGGHPSFSFRTSHVVIGGVARDLIETRRYVAGEVAPSYTLSRHIAAGAYYLYARGLDVGGPRHTHLLAARVPLSNLPLPGGLLIQAVPQFYYLRTNGEAGTYFSTTLSLGRPGFPLSLSAIVNQPAHTKVTGGRDFLWNVGVTYSAP